MSKFVWGMWLLLAVVPAPAAAADADGQWQIGTSPSFSSGDYGTGLRTVVLHTPFTARRLFDKGDVTFVVPITCISGIGGITVVDGSPVRNERLGNVGSADRTGRGITSPVLPLTNACGLGDIIVRGHYYLVDGRDWAIALRGHVKAPTASAERGLGTGRPDEGVGLEVSRFLAGGLLAMVDAGFTFIGEPTGAQYNNNWWYDLGVGRDLTEDVNLSVFFEEDRAIVPGLPNARDILTAVTLKGAAGWRFQVSGQFGLSDGAPHHGLILGASRRF